MNSSRSHFKYDYVDYRYEVDPYYRNVKKKAPKGRDELDAQADDESSPSLLNDFFYLPEEPKPQQPHESDEEKLRAKESEHTEGVSEEGSGLSQASNGKDHEKKESSSEHCKRPSPYYCVGEDLASNLATSNVSMGTFTLPSSTLVKVGHDAVPIPEDEADPLPTSEETAKRYFDTFIWNERFQVLLERPITTPEEAKERNLALQQLVDRFILAAKPIVKKIVEEMDLPPEKRTMKSLMIEGIEGKRDNKFVTEQTIIRFTEGETTYHLYKTDDYAQKAAAQELKSLNALMACGVSALHFPLVVLVNYLGYRLLVASRLPISKKTLVYGSQDGGYHITTADKTFEKKLQAACKVMTKLVQTKKKKKK
ncbi:hypothetical protein QOT17_021474 [Balamuthia mandrillaris]